MDILRYDVCVIGSGPAGFATAMRSYDYGNHVAIIEGASLGGAGISGVLVSKTLWEFSRNYATVKRTDRGYKVSNVKLNYTEIKKRVEEAIEEREYQLLSQIETFSKKPNSKKSITLINGWAKFKDSKRVIVKKSSGEEIIIEANSFVIATGSSPRVHPMLKVDGKKIINSDYILSLKKFPKSILIIGAGVVGCEFATVFANFSETKVHLLDSQKRVIPFEDDDVSSYVNQKLLDIGVIHHDATLREVREGDKHSDVILDYSDGHTEVIAVEVIFISIGRVPNTKDIGLENIGVEVDNRGLLKVNNKYQVAKNIYAVGDISGNMALVNIAEMEGRFVARAIAGDIKRPLSYHNISTIMFFNPEISAIGLTEKECKAKNISYKVITYQHSLISRAIAMRETDGFFKIIVTNEENPLILGVRAGGLQSAVSIIFIATIMNNHTRLNDIMKTIHPHPSISEGIQECLRILKGKSILKAEAFPEQIKFKISH